MKKQLSSQISTSTCKHLLTTRYNDNCLLYEYIICSFMSIDCSMGTMETKVKNGDLIGGLLGVMKTTM